MAVFPDILFVSRIISERRKSTLAYKQSWSKTTPAFPKLSKWGSKSPLQITFISPTIWWISYSYLMEGEKKLERTCLWLVLCFCLALGRSYFSPTLFGALWYVTFSPLCGLLSDSLLSSLQPKKEKKSHSWSIPWSLAWDCFVKLDLFPYAASH